MAEDTEAFSQLDLIPDDSPLGVDPELIDTIGNVADPEEEELIPLGRGWSFDFERGQFNRHGAAPAVVTEIDNLRIWIEKALRTHRGAHPIYSTSFGTDMPHQGIGQQFTPEAVGMLSTAIESALLAHDRIEEVTDFTFTGSEDSEVLFVDFTVIVDNEEIEFTELPLGESF
jgi:hypothetical protein